MPRQAGFAVGQLCLLIGKLRGGVIEVLLCLREFGLQTLQPRLEHRQRQLPAELRPVERVYRRLSRAYLALEPVDDRLIRRKRKLLRGLKLAARRRQLRLLLCDLRLGGCKLRAPRVYLLLLFVQQGAVLLYLLPRGGILASPSSSCFSASSSAARFCSISLSAASICARPSFIWLSADDSLA